MERELGYMTANVEQYCLYLLEPDIVSNTDRLLDKWS